MAENISISSAQETPKEKKMFIIQILGVASFLVMFQAYLVAPLIPALSKEFHSSKDIIGLIIPAFTIPYGLSSLFYGPLSDRFGRRPVILFLLGIMAVSTICISFSRSASEFLMIRLLMGVVTGGIVPISVALVSDLYPYEQRGKPIGYLFSAMAGGMTFGSTLGAYLNPIIGWRFEFVLTGLLCLCVFIFAIYKPQHFPPHKAKVRIGIKEILINCHNLIISAEGIKIYSFIYINGIFQSGVFAWLGYYLSLKYHLTDQGIGIALLGYGLPGMLLGVVIGKAADKYGRSKIIPLGLLIGAISVAVLIFHFPIWIIAIAMAFLSLSYDMTHPLLAGMVSSIGNGSNRGQALGLGSCLLFLGYGSGALVFQYLLHFGLNTAFILFAIMGTLMAISAWRVFRNNF
jgi:predicted MFS family arabinose efflux permease